jgi:hypothetical protein
MAQRTQQEYDNAADWQKNTTDRAIDATGTVRNYNLTDLKNDPQTQSYYVDYFGKITKFYIDESKDFDEDTTQTAYERFETRFLQENPVYFEPEIPDSILQLTEAMDKSLQNSTDGCSILGTMAALSPNFQTAKLAKDVESSVSSVLTKTADGSGAITEALSETQNSVVTAETLTAEVGELIPRLYDELDPPAEELATKLATALNDYLLAVENRMNGVNEAAGPQGNTLIAEINEAMTTVQDEIVKVAQETGNFVRALSSGNCNETLAALAAANKTPPGKAGEIKEKLDDGVPKYSRRIQANGALVNFNIDKTQPYRDVRIQIQTRNYDAREGEDPLYPPAEHLVRVYGTEAQLTEKYGPAPEPEPVVPDPTAPVEPAPYTPRTIAV